jgi:hypothetical protein
MRTKNQTIEFCHRAVELFQQFNILSLEQQIHELAHISQATLILLITSCGKNFANEI